MGVVLLVLLRAVRPRLGTLPTQSFLESSMLNLTSLDRPCPPGRGEISGVADVTNRQDQALESSGV